MTKSVVITLIGDDRPGIVEDVSRIIVSHDGEWIESRMANLSGKFAGILRADLPDGKCEAFAEEVKSGVAGVQVSIELADSETQPSGQCYRLDLIGQDRPGIIHRISSALASNGATVEDLESEVVDASMSGEKLFKATITLCLEEGRNIDELGEILEQLANELIVDIELG